jgi:hypothetical protein
MKYQVSRITRGAWAKASGLISGSKAVIVSETNPQPSQFQNKDGSVKMQDVCKVRFGEMPEAMNVSLNRTTINGLAEAFGEDSVNWQNKPLTVETEKVRVAGKAVVALYLIPEGYEKTDDANGFAVIIKRGSNIENVEADIPVINDSEEIDVKDIPY